MFDINKVHDHQRYKIVQEMADDQDLNVGINFIKYGKNNPDKAGNQNLSDGSVAAVENSEKYGGNDDAGITVMVNLLDSRLHVSPHQKFFNHARREAGKNNQCIIVPENMGKMQHLTAHVFVR